MLLRAAAIWFVIMLIAIINGALRDKIISPATGEAAGHVISTALLCLMILIAAFLTINWIAPSTSFGAIQAGIVWLILTLAFEFLAGHYLFGASWEKLLSDYDLTQGRVWPLVLLACLAAPPIAYFFIRRMQLNLQ